jgi:hypothetical protein
MWPVNRFQWRGTKVSFRKDAFHDVDKNVDVLSAGDKKFIVDDK